MKPIMFDVLRFFLRVYLARFLPDGIAVSSVVARAMLHAIGNCEYEPAHMINNGVWSENSALNRLVNTLQSNVAIDGTATPLSSIRVFIRDVERNPIPEVRHNGWVVLLLDDGNVHSSSIVRMSSQDDYCMRIISTTEDEHDAICISWQERDA